jgi:hypothetical protein
MKADTFRAMSIERLIGGGLAMCAHPYAAWRTRSRRTRAAVVVSYATAGYVAVLATLLLFK